MGGGPIDDPVTCLCRQLDRSAAGGGDDPGTLDRVADQLGGPGGTGRHRGRKAQGAIHDDPHTHAQLGVVGGPFESPVPKAHMLGADSLHPELRVRATEPLAFGQDRIPDGGEPIRVGGILGGTHRGE